MKQTSTTSQRKSTSSTTSKPKSGTTTKPSSQRPSVTKSQTTQKCQKTQTKPKPAVKKQSTTSTTSTQFQKLKDIQPKDGPKPPPMDKNKKFTEREVYAQSKIFDYQLNPKASEMAKQEKIYNDFLIWFEKNGGKYRGLDFPVAFGNSGYLGVAASEDLPANSAFLSVPNHLTISSLSVAEDEVLGPIIKENLDFFDSEENDDGDFNKLAMFIVYENAKQENSFWKPFLDVCQNPTTIAQWDELEIEEFQDEHLKKQAIEYMTELEDTWVQFDMIAQEHPDVFPKGSYDRETFVWAFEVVMTRSFGHTLPGSFLVPMADFMNHNKRGNLYFLVNKKFEKKKKSGYKMKNSAIDLSITGDIEQTQTQIKQIRMYEDDMINTLEAFQGKLKDKIDIKNAFYEDKYDLLDHVRDLNYQRIAEKKDEEIWNQEFYSTSEDEENDSDSEDESLNKNSEFYKMKCKESQEVSKKLMESKSDQDKSQGQKIQTVQLQQIEKREKNERQSKQLVDFQDEEWDWYETDDENNYLTFVTHKPIKKGQQMFLCYGRRSNRFLMMWYGFCFMNNAYDSSCFRLLQSWETQPITEFDVFTEYISLEDWDEDQYKYKGTVYTTDSFTKEFKLKKNSICEDLLSYIRMKLLKVYRENDFFDIKITLPSAFKFELETLEAALNLLEKLKQERCQSPIEEDQHLLEWPNMPWKQRFSVIYRKEQKEIILNNIKLVKLAINILMELMKTNGKGGMKDAYMKKYPDAEGECSEYEYFLNRENLRGYLRQVYIGIILTQKK